MISPEQRAHLKEQLPKRLRWIREEFPGNTNAWVTFCAGYAQGYLHSQLSDDGKLEYFNEIAQVVHELLSEAIEKRSKDLFQGVQEDQGRPFVYRKGNQGS
jgi:hypothetical protein